MELIHWHHIQELYGILRHLCLLMPRCAFILAFGLLFSRTVVICLADTYCSSRLLESENTVWSPWKREIKEALLSLLLQPSKHFLFFAVADTRMSDEIVHNLDGCEISLIGEELDPEKEYLVLDGASLQQRGLELINTSAYLTITGGHLLDSSSLSSIIHPLPWPTWKG